MVEASDYVVVSSERNKRQRQTATPPVSPSLFGDVEYPPGSTVETGGPLSGEDTSSSNGAERTGTDKDHDAVLAATIARLGVGWDAELTQQEVAYVLAMYGFYHREWREDKTSDHTLRRVRRYRAMALDIMRHYSVLEPISRELVDLFVHRWCMGLDPRVERPDTYGTSLTFMMM